ncbi:MAG: NTP transferase domain-containing protein [Candidatus Verstraetearchaeota archaeon]|nr:NTP transferase domain-containing protein [Candidatus Verstraetearchaeota archaeon]
MRLLGLVMAGGRGCRMALRTEKPMLLVGGVPMVRRVVDALRGAPSISKVCAAVSPYTPETKKYLNSLGNVIIIDTPGLGYHDDMRFAVKEMGMECFLTVSADLPLLSPRVVESVALAYKRVGKPSLVVAAPLRLFSELGLLPTYVIERDGERFVPCGINVIDGREIDKPYIEEGICIIDDPSVCMNVNTVSDLRAAESYLRIRMDKPS